MPRCANWPSRTCPTRQVSSRTTRRRSSANRQNFSRRTKNLALQAAQLPCDVYSAGGEAISIVPAMEPTALEADRYRSEIRPWISLHAVLRGSPGLLDGYPPDRRSRRSDAAWGEAQTAYFHRGDPEVQANLPGHRAIHGRRARAGRDDRTRSAATSRRWSATAGVLAKTAYPTAFATDAEVLYNRVDPFFWSGCASLAAACHPGLVVARSAQAAVLDLALSRWSAGVVLIVGGFAVRMYITHWAPVTSMFETIVWVTMCFGLADALGDVPAAAGADEQDGLEVDGHSRQLGGPQLGANDRASVDADRRRVRKPDIRAVALAHAAGVVRRRTVRRAVLHGCF